MSSINLRDEPIAYLNGKLIPFQEATLPVYDLSVMQGATVTERLRTFKHQPFQIEEHLNRLQTSLRLVGWSPSPLIDSLPDMLLAVAEHNSQLIESSEDLSLVVFISAGQAVGDANGLIESSSPTICVYSAKLPFCRWSDSYQHGTHLIIPEIRQIPRTSIDPRIKMRSRLHWLLADQYAREQHPAAMALLLDEHDHLTETSSGNLMLVKNGHILTPCQDATLNGISQEYVSQLCNALNVTVQYKNLTALDLYQADEAFLTSSTYCLMPVGTVNGQQIGQITPGRVTQQLQQLWSESVGVNFVTQAVEQTREMP